MQQKHINILLAVGGVIVVLSSLLSMFGLRAPAPAYLGGEDALPPAISTVASSTWITIPRADNWTAWCTGCVEDGSVRVVSTSSRRVWLRLQATSSVNSIILSFGDKRLQATSTGAAMTITATSTFEIDTDNLFTGSIRAKSDGATTTLYVIQGTY